jgi:3-phosphoshikimate 1-carboxyvinyltransferase
MRWIKPSKIDGRVPAPPSKSAMIRAIAAASLAGGVSEIRNPAFCDDALAALGVSVGLGAKVACSEKTVKIKGQGRPVRTVLDCGESGLCLRLFAPVAALRKTETTLAAHGSLKTRPVSMIEAPLAELGVACRSNAGFPPLTVKGPLRGGRASLDASVSSQFLTGLLTSLPACEGDSELTVSKLTSRPYVDLTMSVLERFGISVTWEKTQDIFKVKGGQRFEPQRYEVEGDWSAAAFLLVAGAIAGRITVEKLSTVSRQADRRILDVLRDAGAIISTGDTEVAVEAGDLRAFDFDATDSPDLFPPLAALACFCEGLSSIRGVHRLKPKESDRGTALVEEFSRIGARFEIRGNVLRIQGRRLEGGVVNSRGDHRLAMAGAVAGLRAGNGVRVERSQAVSKSYPRFFDDLASVGGEIA